MLAMEMVGVVVVRLVQGFRGGYMPGPSQFVPLLLTYGGLSILVMYDPLAEIAVILGLLVLLSTLLYTPKGDDQSVGAGITGSLSKLAEHIGTSPPTKAQGVS